MKEQLIKLINHYGLSASKLAGIIGVQPSSISHIISGRNKPSFDFIKALIEKYPEINTKWLLTGNGNMFLNTNDVEKNKMNIITEPTLFNEPIKTEYDNNSSISDLKNENKIQEEVFNSYKSKNSSNITNVKNVKFVILLYDDGTFMQFQNNKE